ncbi:MAG TPA: hypothetical protein DIW43_11220 [Spongiibacteraceae bacterium]|nr:hypothetical protein [Spongiibacteraceae bacterium]HCS28016.1 hypothetical protein [Spongiibacteraceae bacterium]|tara:strand:- start:1120 stop:1755 length:636 start_codon:yes stop_codon:yes gene_type:complete
MSKRKENKNSINKAVRESLARLLESGGSFVQTDVIRGAVRENGKRIGANTLYSKNATTGEYVHADLLREIDEAISLKATKLGKKTKRAKLSDAVVEMARLKKENKKLIDQVVSQQDRIRVYETREGSEGHALMRQEDELYVFAKLVDKLTEGCIVDAGRLCTRYEEKHSDTDRHKDSYDVILRLLRQLKDSRLVGLDSTKIPLHVVESLKP